MRDVDIAWLAGIFEGEGCIAFTGVNTVCLSINMTDRDVIDRCIGIAGVGSVYLSAKNRPRPLWCWHVTRTGDALAVLDLIEPYFGQRRGARAKEARERLARAHANGHCWRGHPMKGDNLYVTPKGQRMCRTCQGARGRGELEPLK